jgi:hypothetical protein
MTHRFAKASQYQHKEAFCLMLYQGKESRRTLDIWNSRDGVTPFMAVIDGEEFQHIVFSFDRCVPQHQLRPGDYFWRDITEAEAERYAAQVVDQHHPRLSESKRAAKIAELAPEFFKHNGLEPHPYLDRAPFISVAEERGL